MANVRASAVAGGMGNTHRERSSHGSSRDSGTPSEIKKQTIIMTEEEEERRRKDRRRKRRRKKLPLFHLEQKNK